MRPMVFVFASVVLMAAAPVPDAVQVHPRIWVLKSAPGPQTYGALKEAGITHVVNLRRDEEPGFDAAHEAAELRRLEIQYVRVAMGRAPSRDDFDIFRMMVNDLPRGAKILVHCGDGNRAAAAVCTYLVLDTGKPAGEALAQARDAGLALPETERAVRTYLARNGKG